MTSGAVPPRKFAGPAKFWATIVLSSVTVPAVTSMPPPVVCEEFPVMVLFEDRRARSVRLDAAAEVGRVVGDGAVLDDQRALASLVAITAARAGGDVVGDGAVDDGNRLDLSRQRGLAGRQLVIAGVADTAAEIIRGEADVAADDALGHGQQGALVDGAHVDGVEPDPRPLVFADVVADDALGDVDAAVAHAC